MKAGRRAIVAPNAVSYRMDRRSAAAAKEVLGDFAGTIICDGYTAYASLRSTATNSSSRTAGRTYAKFVEAEPQHPKNASASSSCSVALYDIEREIHPEVNTFSLLPSRSRKYPA
jgi:hypothetical protein